MAENEKIDRTFLSSLSSGHSIESLISAPLTAVSKANAMMLGGQVQFILDYCFKEKNGSHEPVMIKMNFSGNTPDGCFYIPLITILPLNNLAVDEVSVKFNVEITSAKTHLSTSDGTNKAKPEVIQKKSRISAKIGTEENGKRNRQRKSGGITADGLKEYLDLSGDVLIGKQKYKKSYVWGNDVLFALAPAEAVNMPENNGVGNIYIHEKYPQILHWSDDGKIFNLEYTTLLKVLIRNRNSAFLIKDAI